MDRDVDILARIAQLLAARSRGDTVLEAEAALALARLGVRLEFADKPTRAKAVRQ